MQKDFDGWNEEKKRTENESRTPLFYEREIWWSALGTNIGVESDGKHERFLRPVLITRKFNMHMAIVIPITSKEKAGEKYYMECGGESGKTYTLCLSQIRAMSSKRLFRKIDTVSEHDYTDALEITAHMIRKGLKTTKPLQTEGNLGGRSP